MYHDDGDITSLVWGSHTSTGINFATIVYITRHSEYVHILSEIVL